MTSNQGSYLLPLVSNNWSDLPPMAASHGCLYLYSGHAITHHLPDHLFWLQPLHTAIHPQPPLQESSLPSQHLPSLYVHPTQSLRIDFKSTRIHLLALCGTPALQTVRTMPTPPSMDFAVPTAMLEHQNTSPSSTIQLLTRNIHKFQSQLSHKYYYYHLNIITITVTTITTNSK